MKEASNKVLIADDSKENIKLWEIGLRTSSIEPHFALNGLEASKSFQSDESFKAVVLDLNMPVMDGIETVKFMKSMRPDIPVIAVTGEDTQAIKTKLKNAGFDGHIEKPFKISQMISEIERLIH